MVKDRGRPHDVERLARDYPIAVELSTPLTRPPDMTQSSAAAVAALVMVGCSSPPPARTAHESTAVVQAGAPDTLRLEAAASFRLWIGSRAHCRTRRMVSQDFHQDFGWVLLETKDVTRCQTSEGAAGKITLTRWQDDSIGIAPRYRVSASGDGGRLMDNMYEVIQSISGGGDDTYTYLSLENGKEVFESNVPAIKLSRNNSWRYVAISPPLLQFGDGRRPTTSVRIDGLSGDPHSYCVKEFGFVKPGEDKLTRFVELWSKSDNASGPRATVRARIDGCWSTDSERPAWFEIDVVNDSLDIAHVRASPGISLTPNG
jgi:hypothetical protein